MFNISYNYRHLGGILDLDVFIRVGLFQVYSIQVTYRLFNGAHFLGHKGGRR